MQVQALALRTVTALVVCMTGQQAVGAQAESSINLKVPPKFRGYNLRLSGKKIDLDKESVRVKALNSSQRVELTDADNRLMADHYTKVGSNTVANLREHPLQLGLEIGFGFEAGTKLRKLNLSEAAAYTTGANLVYRPKAYGLFLSYNYHRYHNSGYAVETTSWLESYRTGFGFVYEMAPFSSWPLFFSRMHIALMAGGVWSQHNAKVGEDDVRITDSASTLGPQGAVELRIPLAVNLWLSMRETYTQYRLKMDKLNLDDDIQELNSTVGLRYAF